VIEEDERPDHPPLRSGQYASDLESAQIAAPLLNHQID
jgi:hypothetical protein